MAAIEVIALIMALLVVVLISGILTGWWSGKPGTRPHQATVTLRRLSGFKATHEELHLLVNDHLIRCISDEGARSADYQAQVEELEQLASTLATALDAEVYLRRVDVREHPEFETARA